MSGLCKPGGGNDYVCCIICGVEYNPMRSPPDPVPPCGGKARLAELWRQSVQIEQQIRELEFGMKSRQLPPGHTGGNNQKDNSV